jgi:hypothetical protein
MTDIDKSRLIAAIATRLKIRLDENDPAFVLVELNRLVLDQAVQDVLQKVRDIESRLTTRPDFDPHAAEEFATVVARRLAASHSQRPTAHPGVESKVVAGNSPARIRTHSACTWATALVSAIVLALCSLAIGYQLGVMHDRLP